MPRPASPAPAPQVQVLAAIQRGFPITTHALATRLGITVEAARQSLARLMRTGFVSALPREGDAPRARGRPAARFVLTAAGLEALPKAYAEMTLSLVGAVADGLGSKALSTVLGALTDARVHALAPHVDGLPLARRMRALRAIYRADDAFLSVAREGKRWRLTERNCPFLRVALAHPAVCSTTVATLSRLLGCKVVRDQRFQSGDGCCSFVVDPGVPSDPAARGFVPEPPIPVPSA